jgi:hypothetical protein
MDPVGFNSLVKNHTCLTEDECSNLGTLSTLYPYSQIISLLHARASRDLNHPDQTNLLHRAAAYSTERIVLKQIMIKPKGNRIPMQVPTAVLKEKPKVKEEPKAKEVPQVVEARKTLPEVAPPAPPILMRPADGLFRSADIKLSGDALRDDLKRELEKLHRLTHQFSDQLDEFQNTGIATPLPILESMEKEPTAEPLLEEIRSTKKKLKVVNPKQKEQNEIIDQFIRTKPVVPKPKSENLDTDLSEDSGMFSDHIVSETLVNILLKQGKKDKAIEVLKKLIWKFPQKKAYFAAQIDGLKN